jgi:prepilin-type N-terminal cleavage/methylation domain-containing protein
MVMIRTHASFGRAGFTLIELVVVIAIIGVLAGLGVPSYLIIVNRSKVTTTQALVVLVADAIAGYNTQSWVWNKDPNSPVVNLISRPIFALKDKDNRTFIPKWRDGKGNPISFCTIDGRPRPAVSPGSNTTATVDVNQYDQFGSVPYDQAIARSGYMGFYDMAGAAIDKRFVNAKHQVIDAWGEPLRIAHAINIFGAIRGFGVWSPGRDRLDQDLTENAPPDDLRSWQGPDEQGKKK